MNNWVNLQIIDKYLVSLEFSQTHLLVCPQPHTFHSEFSLLSRVLLDPELDSVLEIIQETLSTLRSLKASVK